MHDLRILFHVLGSLCFCVQSLLPFFTMELTTVVVTYIYIYSYINTYACYVGCHVGIEIFYILVRV